MDASYRAGHEYLRRSGSRSTLSSTNEFTVEAWVQPATTSPTSTGTIAAIVADSKVNDFSLSQGQASGNRSGRFDARLRTTRTSKKGETIRTNRGLVTINSTYIVLTRDALGVTRIYINGAEQAERTIKGYLTNWIASSLMLANDAGGLHPWLGKYQHLVFYNRALSPTEVTQRFNLGSNATR